MEERQLLERGLRGHGAQRRALVGCRWGGGGDKARKGKGRQGFRKERVPKWDLWELT